MSKRSASSRLEEEMEVDKPLFKGEEQVALPAIEDMAIKEFNPFVSRSDAELRANSSLGLEPAYKKANDGYAASDEEEEPDYTPKKIPLPIDDKQPSAIFRPIPRKALPVAQQQDGAAKNAETNR